MPAVRMKCQQYISLHESSHNRALILFLYGAIPLINYELIILRSYLSEKSPNCFSYIAFTGIFSAVLTEEEEEESS